MSPVGHDGFQSLDPSHQLPPLLQDPLCSGHWRPWSPSHCPDSASPCAPGSRSVQLINAGDVLLLQPIVRPQSTILCLRILKHQIPQNPAPSPFQNAHHLLHTRRSVPIWPANFPSIFQATYRARNTNVRKTNRKPHTRDSLGNCSCFALRSGTLANIMESGSPIKAMPIPARTSLT